MIFNECYISYSNRKNRKKTHFKHNSEIMVKKTAWSYWIFEVRNDKKIFKRVQWKTFWWCFHLFWNILIFGKRCTLLKCICMYVCMNFFCFIFFLIKILEVCQKTLTFPKKILYWTIAHKQSVLILEKIEFFFEEQLVYFLCFIWFKICKYSECTCFLPNCPILLFSCISQKIYEIFNFVCFNVN